MAEMRILSGCGDTTVSWDARKAATDDPEAAAALHEAERIFEEAQARGATAFSVAPDRPARRLDRFDPSEERIVVIPRVAGG